PTPTVSPEPTVAASLAIANDVEIVGQSAAFSADGRWFAFTARPADGSGGPDVYIWKVGQADARPLTSDGVSTFASWAGNDVVVSRPVATDTVAEAAAPITVTVDPGTGAESAGGSTWRPVVDPSGQRAVTWDGTIALVDGTAWQPAAGRLELRDWPIDAGAVDDGAQIVVDDVLADFDVRWDGSGSWFAVWTADPTDTSLGRLSLYRVNADTGLLEQPDGAPVDVPALPGFSIGEGRLAWATPPGQGGEGSRVHIVAWTTEGVGSIETAPGAEIIVIR
ncbi:MAG: hypothetical protein ABIQ58_08880, partial [Candidatus Limnocylindrales bacterium]